MDYEETVRSKIRAINSGEFGYYYMLFDCLEAAKEAGLDTTEVEQRWGHELGCSQFFIYELAAELDYSWEVVVIDNLEVRKKVLIPRLVTEIIERKGVDMTLAYYLNEKAKESDQIPTRQGIVYTYQ